MKRLDRVQYLFLVRRQRLLVQRRTRRKKRKEKQKRLLFGQSLSRLRQPEQIVAPRVFELFDPKPRTALLSFLKRLRQKAVSERVPIQIDFSHTHKMVADGTLLFVAELRRILRLTEGTVPIRCSSLPRNSKVAQVLKKVGVFSLLHCRMKIKPVDSDVIHWRFATGHKVLGEKYDKVLGPYDGVLASSIQTGFYHGLTEAMTNCIQHAYIELRNDGLGIRDDEPEWWMFSQERDGILCVVFCDLGAGIPVTLQTTKPGLWKKIVSLGKPSDGKIIREAIEFSKSRTGKAYRGKGLKQLLEAVQGSKDGRLIIYSNFGRYLFDGGKEMEFDYKDSIAGTLIAWRIPIDQDQSVA